MAIRESIADSSSNKDDNMDGKEEEEGSEEVDSSGGKVSGCRLSSYLASSS